MFGWEAESSEMVTDNTTFHDWIAMKVSQILLEELLDIIDRITNRLIVKFEERVAISSAAREASEADSEGNMIVEARFGKIKQAHNSERLEGELTSLLVTSSSV